MFAQYWDKVEDPRDISGVSRFMSGGMGGISSQLSAYISAYSLRLIDTVPLIGIYPIETMKVSSSSLPKYCMTPISFCRRK